MQPRRSGRRCDCSGFDLYSPLPAMVEAARGRSRSIRPTVRPLSAKVCRRRRPVRPSEGPHLPVHHRNVGALLVLRDARAARPLHDQISAAAGPCRQRGRLGRLKARARVGVRAARRAAVVVADLRLLYRAGLSDADFRRTSGRPRARPAPHRGHRRRPDGDRPFHDGGRAAVPVRAARADPRQRRVQAEHLHPGRRALCAGRSAPRPRLFDLLCRHQCRRVPGAAGLRHARRGGGLALRLCRRRRRHADRARDLSLCDAAAAARRAAEGEGGACRAAAARCAANGAA